MPDSRPAVPVRYTWKQVQGYVAAEHTRKRSMRQIADDINRNAGSGVVNITHRTVQLILAGHEPQSPKIRRTLGLPVLVSAPVCAKCGVVHSRQCRQVPEWLSAASDWLAKRQKENEK